MDVGAADACCYAWHQIAVRDKPHLRAEVAQFFYQFLVPGSVEYHDDQVLDIAVQRICNDAEVVFRRGIEIKSFPARLLVPHHLRTDDQFIQIDVGRVPETACFGHRHHRNRSELVLCCKIRALEWIDRDIDLGTLPGSDLLADIEHRRLIPLALADDDLTIDIEPRQHSAHRLDRGIVRGMPVPETDPSCRSDRSSLGHLQELQEEILFELAHLRDHRFGNADASTWISGCH